MSALSRSEIRKKEFQQRIIHAAERLFAEHGVAETSVASIIKAAGIAHKTFFNHFPTKNHLLFHIANIYADYSDAIFQQAQKMDTKPLEKIEYCFSHVAKNIESMGEKQTAMFKYILNGVQLGPENSKVKQYENVHKSLSAILYQARDQGELIPGLDVDIYAEVVTSLFLASIMRWASLSKCELQMTMRRNLAFIEHSIFI